jgi:hypothetical protein
MVRNDGPGSREAEPNRLGSHCGPVLPCGSGPDRADSARSRLNIQLEAGHRDEGLRRRSCLAGTMASMPHFSRLETPRDGVLPIIATSESPRDIKRNASTHPPLYAACRRGSLRSST